MNGQTVHTLSEPCQFPATRWTLVVAAASPQRKEARSALVSLCESYWYPLYAYLRRRGHPADQAQDLTQEFFMRVLEGRNPDRTDPEKGRFRSFILTSLKFFVAYEEDRRRAQKRGGGTVAPLEISSAEERYQREPAHGAYRSVRARPLAHYRILRKFTRSCFSLSVSPILNRRS